MWSCGDRKWCSDSGMAQVTRGPDDQAQWDCEFSELRLGEGCLHSNDSQVSDEGGSVSSAVSSLLFRKSLPRCIRDYPSEKSFCFLCGVFVEFDPTVRVESVDHPWKRWLIGDHSRDSLRVF
jgi:hypothetical protein